MQPVVAIVGRPNVGKSELFNRIAGKKLSLVYDQPGVTRDRIHAQCEFEGRSFTLMDTGGIGLDDNSGFEADIEREVGLAMDCAGIIFFVVDGRAGLQPVDREVANRLRRARQEVFLVVNKLDTEKQENWEMEFHELGFSRLFPVSAAHGRGVRDLMEAAAAEWPEAPRSHRDASVLNIAVVGKPNVGKSSLINALLEEDRVIVSPLAGTTRDAVDVFFEHEGVRYCLVDTAGMRKRARLEDPLERAMTARSAHSINRADLCVLVMDAALGVTSQEKKIAGLIQQAGKPCVLVVNKWDLTREAGVFSASKERGNALSPEAFLNSYREALYEELFFLKYAPVVFTSALEKRRLGGWFTSVQEVHRASRTILPAGRLNRLLGDVMTRHPPVREGKRQLKIYYLAQKREGVSSTTLLAFINNRDLWREEYQRFLEGAIREEYPLPGCPILWILKDKSEQKKSRKNPKSSAPGKTGSRH